jgi:hypothetical protein
VLHGFESLSSLKATLNCKNAQPTISCGPKSMYTVRWICGKLKLIFSDESKFNLHRADGKLYVRCREGEQYHLIAFVSPVKFPATQIIWGCISSKGVGRLHFIKGTVNVEVYKKNLNMKLLPTTCDQFRNTDSCIFQDDCTPCDRAKSVSSCVCILYRLNVHMCTS